MKEHYVESETNEGTFYKITVEEVKKIECTCQAFKYHKTCKHIEEFK